MINELLGISYQSAFNSIDKWAWPSCKAIWTASLCDLKSQNLTASRNSAHSVLCLMTYFTLTLGQFFSKNSPSA